MIRLLIYIITAPLLLLAQGAYSQCTISAFANGGSNTVYICPGQAVNLSSTGGCPTYVMNNNFNNGTPGAGWSATNQAMFNKPCTPHSPDGTIYLWMGSTSTAPRTLTTVPFDVSQGGTIEFEMRYAVQGASSPCEGPDLYNEGIAVQYSINNGSTWNTMEYYAPNGNILNYIPTTTSPGTSGQTQFTVWTTRSITIPPAAQTTATRFRWAQTVSTSAVYDHWGLDNVKIIVPPPTVNVWWNHGPTVHNPPTVYPASNTSYTVNITDGSSTSSSSVNVVINPVPTSSFTATPQVCAGLPATVSYTGSAGANATYNWNFNGGTVVSGSGQGPYQISWANSGTYNVSLTITENGCTSTPTSVQVIVNPNPVPVISPVNPSICPGQNINLSTSLPYSSYLWSTGATTSSMSASVTGNYSVTVTDVNGCKGNIATNVNVAPVISFSAIDSNVLCNGGNSGSITLNAGGGTPPFTYAWTPAISTGSYAGGLSAGSYSVVISDQNNCDTSATFLIIEPPALVLSSNADTTICAGQSLNISASATGGVMPYDFNWSGGLGSGTSFNVSPSTTTSYSVSVTDANNCIAGPANFTVYVNPDLIVNLTASPNYICQGQQSSISASVSGGSGGPYIYTWGHNPAVNSSQVSVSPIVTTTYTVTVTDHCGTPPATANVVVNVFPVPQPVFNAGVYSGCSPLYVEFSDLTGPGVQNWLWNFGDPASGLMNTSSLQSPVHTFTGSGSYSISLDIITSDGCQGSTTLNNMIQVYSNPTASFTATPNPASSVEPTVSYYDQSINAGSWYWNFGDVVSQSNTSVLQNPMHTYSNPGSYMVWLVVESPQGCIDSVSLTVNVTEDYAFYVPNAFSPNDDGINDIFRPKGISIDPDKYEMYIYDRWGQEVFMTKDINHGWDGRVSNGREIAKQDVFSWVIRFSKIKGMEHVYKGRVTIIK